MVSHDKILPMRRGKRRIAATVAVLSGFGYFFLFRGYSRYWDVFWMIILGIGVGGHAGQWLAGRVPEWRKSDGPALLCGNLCVATMVAIWWMSSPDMVAFVGAVCRSLAGAYVGAMAVEILTMEPYRRPGHPAGGRADG